MLDKLDSVLKQLPDLLQSPEEWSSLVSNRRKPVTYRLFRQVGDVRVCLHHFERCDPQEAFHHPHPWPAAFLILEGSYLMALDHSLGREGEPLFGDPKVLMVPGSRYEILNPQTWHSVQPVDEKGVWTVMVNGAPWPADVAHRKVRTTKGKDLEEMPPEMVKWFCRDFAVRVRHHLPGGAP